MNKTHVHAEVKSDARIEGAYQRQTQFPERLGRRVKHKVLGFAPVVGGKR
jgi:hypothetical protein